MTTLPRATISPGVLPSAGTSRPWSSTTRSSPEVISSTPCRALIRARSSGDSDSMLGPRLADADRRRGFGEAVDLDDRPAELVLDALDRDRRRRRARGHHADALRRERLRFGRRVGEHDQHGRRRAQARDLFLPRRSWNTVGPSNFGRQTCFAPAAVTVHVNVQPLAWNIGSVHR